MRLLLIILLVVVFGAGCANPLYKPFKRTTETVFPEYLKYVGEDKKLTKEQKQRRVNGCNNAKKLLRDYEQVERN